jgi:hypothetical protein
MRPPKGTFLRQNTRFEPSIMKIGSTVRAVREPEKIVKTKNKNKKGQQRYFSRVRGGGTPIGGIMKFGTIVDVPDVINLANFHICSMSSLGAGWGS